MKSLGQAGSDVAIVRSADAIVDFVEDQQIGRLQKIELLLDDFEFIWREGFGFGILPFGKDLVKLVRFRKGDANGVKLNAAFDIPENGAKIRSELGRRGCFGLAPS